LISRKHTNLIVEIDSNMRIVLLMPLLICYAVIG